MKTLGLCYSEFEATTGIEAAVPKPRIGVFFVDDHPVMREGMAALVRAQADMEVLGEAGDAGDALGKIVSCSPDVAVLDLLLPDLDGAELTRQILKVSPKTRMVVLSHCAGGHDISRTLKAGAFAYLYKSSARQDILLAIRSVAAGRRYLPLDVAERLAEHMPATPLTSREQGVLKLMSNGLRNKEIASTLGVSEPTVKEHVRNILSKLGVSDRTAAVVSALRQGILHLSSSS